MAFSAELTGGPEWGVYVQRARSGRLEKIVKPGEMLPDGTLILDTFRTAVNRRGDVLFAGQIQMPPPFQPLWALFLAPGHGPVRAVARPFDLMPDGLEFEEVRLSSRFSLNDEGDVAFAAATRATTDFFTLVGNGIYATTRGRLRYIAREGTVTFGAGQLFSVTSPLGAALINDRGEVALVARTLADRLLLLKAGERVFSP